MICKLQFQTTFLRSSLEILKLGSSSNETVTTSFIISCSEILVNRLMILRETKNILFKLTELIFLRKSEAIFGAVIHWEI